LSSLSKNQLPFLLLSVLFAAYGHTQMPHGAGKSSARFLSWLPFQLEVAQLPRAARLCMTLWATPSAAAGAAAEGDGPRLVMSKGRVKDVPLG
jgi:hypothetical protein